VRIRFVVRRIVAFATWIPAHDHAPAHHLGNAGRPAKRHRHVRQRTKRHQNDARMPSGCVPESPFSETQTPNAENAMIYSYRKARIGSINDARRAGM